MWIRLLVLSSLVLTITTISISSLLYKTTANKRIEKQNIEVSVERLFSHFSFGFLSY